MKANVRPSFHIHILLEHSKQTGSLLNATAYFAYLFHFRKALPFLPSNLFRQTCSKCFVILGEAQLSHARTAIYLPGFPYSIAFKLQLNKYLALQESGAQEAK